MSDAQACISLRTEVCHQAKFFIPKAILTFVIVLLAALNLHAQFPTQKPAGYVNDLAGVLSLAARQQLEALCAELDHKTKAQLAIVTVKSLEGRPLEEFTVDLATKWGIGPKGSDRGVMLFLAIQDRRSRIEVGYGLEPIIPDGRAGGILRAMTPYLRNNDYDGAMRLGASTIAQIIAQNAGVTLNIPVVVPPESQPESLSRRTGTYFDRGTESPSFLAWMLVALIGGLAIAPIYFLLPSARLSRKQRLWIATASVFFVSLLFTIRSFEGTTLGEIVPYVVFLIMAGSGLLLLILVLEAFGKGMEALGLGGNGGGSDGGWSSGGGFGGFGGGSFGGGGASGSW